VEGWRSLLTRTGLAVRYKRITQSIEFGFTLNIPPITANLHPPNRDSAAEHRAVLDAEFEKEYAAERYLGPFTAASINEALGPFQTSPLSVIPKASGGHRIIQNFSYPYKPIRGISSVNSQLYSSDHPCTWGTFHAVAQVISALPDGCEIAVRDVKSAFRTIPIRPEEWAALVVRCPQGEDAFCVDTANPFGPVNGPGVHGELADAYCDVVRAVGMGPLGKWVDDHYFIRLLRTCLPEYNRHRRAVRDRIIKLGGEIRRGARLWWDGGDMPDGRPMELVESHEHPVRDHTGSDLAHPGPRAEQDRDFAYTFADITQLSDELGVIFGAKKDSPFAPSGVFTGLVWDVQAKTVGISETKRAKYEAALADFLANEVAPLRAVQSIYGKLAHACLVMPEGRAYLTGLERAMGAFALSASPFASHRITREVRDDLAWWTRRLCVPIPVRPLPIPVSVRDTRAYSDASSGVGVGVYIDGWWRAWRLRERWDADGRDIGWAEAVGFELLVRVLIDRGLRDEHVVIWGDNKGVVEGWWKGRSRGKFVNAVFRRIHPVVSERGIHVHSRYVRSADNPADGPSRGVYGRPDRLLPRVDLGEALDAFLINCDEDEGDERTDERRQRAIDWGRAQPKHIPDGERARRAKLASERDDDELVDLAILGVGTSDL
jgi:hypothetical protein